MSSVKTVYRCFVIGTLTLAWTACNPDVQQPQTAAQAFGLSTVDHTTFQSGDIPILITVPHGGSDAPAGLSTRTISYGELVTNKELYLRDIALDVADRLENVHDIVPYLVLGEVHRQYLDYNRDEDNLLNGGPENEAYESAAAETYYDDYHARIDGYVGDIQTNHGSGLLIDMHGTGSVPDKIVRGTRNGDAIWELLSGHDVTSITASEEYAGQTAAMAHDGDLGTRWKSFGTNEWIEFDLGSSKTISSVEIAITDGASRIYDFEVEVWNGSSWDVAFDGSNSEQTSDFEIYDFSTPLTGSKVRVSCHGSNYSNANYIKEIRIQELGWDPIVGPGSLFGEMSDAGYTLQPANSEIGTAAETVFIGGFTVEEHGSYNGGVDAVQMEIGLNYRDTAQERDDLVVDIADAIYSYYTTYSN